MEGLESASIRKLSPLEKLENDGEENGVAEFLSPEKSSNGRYDLPEPADKDFSCNLDCIDVFPKCSREDIFLRDSSGNYVVETADKKGHEVRNMLVYSDHGVMAMPGDFDYDTVQGNMFEDFLDLTASQIRNNDQVEDRMALIIGLNDHPCHYHVIASDIDGGNPGKIDDLGNVNNYIYWDMSDGFRLDEPDRMRMEDLRGEGLQPLYENLVE